MSLKRQNYHEFTHEKIKFKDMLKLLEKSEFEKEITEALKLNLKNGDILINGTKDLLDKFLNFENSFLKIDLKEKLINTDFLSFNLKDLKKIKECNLKIGGSKVETAYSTKHDYINLVHLKSLYDVCAGSEDKYSNEIREKLEENFLDVYDKNKKLLGNLPTNNKLYRLISLENKVGLYLRAICSTSYKNYNNKVTIFLALYMLNKFGENSNQKLQVEKLFMTDSKIKLVLRTLEPKILKDNIGKVYPTYEIYNSELGDGAFIISQSYIFNFNGKNIYLNINEDSKNIKNKCLSVSHSSNVETLIEQVNKGILESQNYERDLISLATKLYKKNVSEAFLIDVIQSIVSSTKSVISLSTKEQIKKLQITISTSIKIIELLKEIDSIKMEFEEKEYINYLFYNVLKKLKI